MTPPRRTDKPVISSDAAFQPKGILDYVLNRCANTYVRLARTDIGTGPKLVWAIIMNHIQSGRTGSPGEFGYVIVVVDATTGDLLEEMAYEPPIPDSQLRSG